MIIFQCASISLMLFQSFFAAYFLGLTDFGLQMLALAPIFLGQAIFEPFAQAEANSVPSDQGLVFNGYSLLFVGFFVFILVASLALWVVEVGHTLLLLIFCSYIIYTLLLAVGFSRKLHRICSLASILVLLSYILAFFSTHWMQGINQILVANLLGFSVASVFLFFATRSHFSIHFEKGAVFGLKWIDALFFRLPVIFFTSVSVLIMGAFGQSAALIGEYKVFTSAVSAGRYFNIIPLAQLQVAIAARLRNEFSDFRNIAHRYAVSFFIFSAVLVLFFPILYGITIDTPSFSRFDLWLGSFLTLLQPMAYFVFLQSNDRSERLSVPVLVFFALGVSFSVLIFITGNPFISLSVAVCSAVVIYTVKIVSISPRA